MVLFALSAWLQQTRKWSSSMNPGQSQSSYHWIESVRVTRSLEIHPGEGHHPRDTLPRNSLLVVPPNPVLSRRHHIQVRWPELGNSNSLVTNNLFFLFLCIYVLIIITYMHCLFVFVVDPPPSFHLWMLSSLISRTRYPLRRGNCGAYISHEHAHCSLTLHHIEWHHNNNYYKMEERV